MRLGCLPYLNVKPLVYSLEQGGLPRGWEFVYAPPSELARMLARGEVDAAPVSSFAVLQDPDLEICPGICIAANGPVKSVLMLSRKEVSGIDTVALDASSLSGANMLKIILAESYGRRPEFVPMSPAPVAAMLGACDAALVIGNPAMLCRKDGLFVLDLGEEWVRLTSLPAVFAVWAGPSMTPEMVSVLRQAKADSVSQLPEIAQQESRHLGLPFEECLDYISRVIIYDLDVRELLGLKAFRDKALDHGLIERPARTEVAPAWE